MNDARPATTPQGPRDECGARAEEPPEPNPVERILRSDRLPHIWCAGCGIGTSVNCFARALEDAEVPLDSVVVVSGIGCAGRVAGYVHLDSFHTTHGRPIPFATGLKLASPRSKVVVYSGDGDLVAIGGNHLIHACRRNVDIAVICINNFTYGMTGGQVAPTTAVGALATTTPYGNLEEPFNIPHLVASSGAVYVARWTTFHVRQLQKSMSAALRKRGFSFIEVLSPCPTLYGRRNRIGDGLAMQRMFKERCVVRNFASTHDAWFDFVGTGQIIVGTFVDRERTAYMDRYASEMRKRFGDAFVPFGRVDDEEHLEASHWVGGEG